MFMLLHARSWKEMPQAGQGANTLLSGITDYLAIVERPVSSCIVSSRFIWMFADARLP